MNDTIAIVNGEAVTELPSDLYIPPDALEVFLETFEGPLDLLLYLIRKQNLDIIQISIAKITEQYMQYISMMKALRLELAAEYLVMAAILAEIKSRSLLPKITIEGLEEIDPKAALLQRLLEYERFVDAAQKIDAMARLERDIFRVTPELPPLNQIRPLPKVLLEELVVTFSEVLERAEMYGKHAITREPLSVEERMTKILTALKEGASLAFRDCFDLREGKMGVVVSFLAILELVRASLLWVSQTKPFGRIYLSLSNQDAEVPCL